MDYYDFSDFGCYGCEGDRAGLDEYYERRQQIAYLLAEEGRCDSVFVLPSPLCLFVCLFVCLYILSLSLFVIRDRFVKS